MCAISFLRKAKESESHSIVSDSLRPPWTLQSMEFSRPEYWSGWPFPSLGDLPNPGINLNKIPLCLLGPNWSMANDCYKRVWETHSVSFERGGSKHTFNTYYMEKSGTSTFIFLKISLTIVPQSPLLLPYHLCSLSELSWQTMSSPQFLF